MASYYSADLHFVLIFKFYLTENIGCFDYKDKSVNIWSETGDYLSKMYDARTHCVEKMPNFQTLQLKVM